MIVYLIEFLLLHSLFFVVYKTLLAKETQLHFLRFFLIGSTILALVIPLIEIPTALEVPTLDFEEMVTGISTSMTIESTQPTANDSLPAYMVVLGIAGGFFFLKLCYSLIAIGKCYHRSEPDISYELPIRKVHGIENSFTFLRWIFIDPSHFENPVDIIKHELGHSQKLHTLDILLFNVLSIFFWWSPTLWLTLRELKKIHEYEADQFALKSVNQNTYIKTLVHGTLRAHGLNLASSFDDAPIVKRLNFIMKMKRKISPWKTGSILAIVLISAAMFACEEQLNDEIQRIAEESTQQFIHDDEVALALKEAQEKYPDKKFTVIETHIDNEESIRKLKEFATDQIEHVFVFKDEDEERVVMIIDEDSDVFKKATALQERHSDEENHWEAEGHEEGRSHREGEEAVFTIVEQQPVFPGGKLALLKYLQANMKYPKKAQEQGIRGRVSVEFLVMKDGSISDVKVVRGIGGGCDEEALRVMRNSPKWTPGTQNGKAVTTKMKFSIQFNPETS